MYPRGRNRRSSRFKLFHELMLKKVRHIMLISTSYEAWIMEEDCRISEQIINEYRGLNLSHPPRLTWVSSFEEAQQLYPDEDFDLVIFFATAVDQATLKLGRKIKEARPGIPVVVLTHQEALAEASPIWHEVPDSIDRVFYWSGQADILLAIVKSIEDQFNAVADTATAGVRIILLVEDSPYYLSLLLPVLYKELVAETQAVIEDGLNEEHRLLSMRARPKILLAQSYEGAMELYESFKPYVLGVISDMRYYLEGRLDGGAGRRLLSHIKGDRFDIPLLLTSSEPDNAMVAATIPALFVDKNSLSLKKSIKAFLVEYLGFGNFIFRMPDGTPYAQAGSLYELEKKLATIPLESFLMHSRNNDFSRWFYTLAEVELASMVRPIRDSTYDTAESHRQHLIQIIKEKRIARQRGVIVNFNKERFDPDTNFAKTGHGSLGGKARGLAFFSATLHARQDELASLAPLEVVVPQTLVVTTDAFDDFVQLNNLHDLVREDLSDQEVLRRFASTVLPSSLNAQLKSYLEEVHYPLAVRSSSLLEDAQFKSYAGLYHTCMLPNDNQDFGYRCLHLGSAIRRVYASTYFQAPKAFSRRVGNRTEQEKMAVVIQEVVGRRYGDVFYPAISGVAQSINYYPFARMKPEEGIVSMALGLGRAVMEGGRILRFSPCHPEILPQRGTVRDILQNSQQRFYALPLGKVTIAADELEAETLVELEVSERVQDQAVSFLASGYEPQEDRIRDYCGPRAIPVMTFASILKHRAYPLAEAVKMLLAMGARGLGCPVEIEFAVDLPPDPKARVRLAVLQIRPMSAREEMLEIEIGQEEIEKSVCVCHQALGNTINRSIYDLVYVRPESFEPAKTVTIARELGRINGALLKEDRKYILCGPGRWGSADHWLGIPVSWADIAGVGAIIETIHPKLKADPSQGSHFFHNITSLGINYLNVGNHEEDRINWQSLADLERVVETDYVVHARSSTPFTLKVDGRQRLGVIFL